jgi:uncharacterized protein YecT (DUF1311 family)
MRRINPAVIAAVVLGLILLLVAVTMLSRRGNSPQDKLSDEQATGTGATAPQSRCAKQATYDRIKIELFRQAAQVRKSDQKAFDRLSTYAVVRMERPLLRSQDEELGTLRCTGHLSLDLPPGVAVVGGRRTLSADIDYVLQPAADGSGDVVMLEGADPIVVPLATLAQSGAPLPVPPAPQSAPVGQPGVAQDMPLPPPAARQPAPQPLPSARAPEPQPAPPATVGQAKPSFNCRYARTRGERAVCGDAGLAALDRQMASQYYRAVASADPGQRRILTSTRDSFLRFRDNCPSNACIAETYRGRIREIRDIMSGDWRGGR